MFYNYLYRIETYDSLRVLKISRHNNRRLFSTMRRYGICSKFWGGMGNGKPGIHDEMRADIRLWPFRSWTTFTWYSCRSKLNSADRIWCMDSLMPIFSASTISRQVLLQEFNSNSSFVSLRPANSSFSSSFIMTDARFFSGKNILHCYLTYFIKFKKSHERD